MKRPPPINLDEKDKQLQEKEAELRRMQEMVAQVCKIIYEEDLLESFSNLVRSVWSETKQFLPR